MIPARVRGCGGEMFGVVVREGGQGGWGRNPRETRWNRMEIRTYTYTTHIRGKNKKNKEIPYNVTTRHNIRDRKTKKKNLKK